MRTSGFSQFLKNCAITLSVLLTLTGTCWTQQSHNSKVVYIQSWEKGEGRITEQRLNIPLSREQSEYETVVLDNLGKRRYKLILQHNPATATSLEFWRVQLREILSKTDGTGEALGYNLLVATQPGPGRHTFSREDLVGDLYPKEDPVKYIDIPFFYPLSATRIIKIEEFYVIVQANSYQFNEKNPKTFDSLNVTIEFKNAGAKGETSIALDYSYK